MLVRGVVFDDFRALLRGCFNDDGNVAGGRFDGVNGNGDGFGYGFDDILVFRPPRLGAARVRNWPRSSLLRAAGSKGPRERPFMR
jgi:hypothetical protein